MIWGLTDERGERMKAHLNKTKEKWVKARNRFVVMFDILGFKDFVMNNKTHDVTMRLESIIEELTLLENDLNSIKIKTHGKDINQTINSENIRINVFSDTIIIITNSDTKRDFTNLIFATNKVMASCIKNSIPIKGAMAHGYIMHSHKNGKLIIHGLPLIDAHLLHDEIKFIGVVLHKSIEIKINEILKTQADNGDQDQFIFQWNCDYNVYKSKVSLKSGNITHNTINWYFALAKELYSLKKLEMQSKKDEYILKEVKKDIKHMLNQFYYSSCGESRKYYDNTIYYLDNIIDKTKLDEEICDIWNFEDAEKKTYI